jgi:glycerate dehydrogenase
MKIVVLDGYTLNPGDNPWTPVEKLGEVTVYDRTAAADILKRARGARVLLTNKTPLSSETLTQLPELGFISVLATGYNVVDTAAARQRDIAVSNVPIYGTDSVAQHVFALLLEMCHNVALHSREVHAGAWTKSADFCFWRTPLVELAGRTIGIVGFGRIGRRVGEIARAFGMNVLAHDSFRGKDPGYPVKWVELPELFRASDVVTLHCPLTDRNKGMVNAALLASMKPTALLINTARGPLINEADLAAALNSEKIAGAAMDVVSKEPIEAANPLLTAKNCLITPHIAWATLSARRRLMETTAQNIAAFQSGKPINVVN